jgi:hypothetical protein
MRPSRSVPGRLGQERLDAGHDDRPPVFVLDVGVALPAERLAILIATEQMAEGFSELATAAIEQAAIGTANLSAQHRASRVHERRHTVVPPFEERNAQALVG